MTVTAQVHPGPESTTSSGPTRRAPSSGTSTRCPVRVPDPRWLRPQTLAGEGDEVVGALDELAACRRRVAEKVVAEEAPPGLPVLRVQVPAVAAFGRLIASISSRAVASSIPRAWPFAMIVKLGVHRRADPAAQVRAQFRAGPRGLRWHDDHARDLEANLSLIWFTAVSSVVPTPRSWRCNPSATDTMMGHLWEMSRPAPRGRRWRCFYVRSASRDLGLTERTCLRTRMSLVRPEAPPASRWADGSPNRLRRPSAERVAFDMLQVAAAITTP